MIPGYRPPQTPPEDSCTECGASFELHQKFGQIIYPVFTAELTAGWIEADEIPLEKTLYDNEYGICSSYKTSL